MRRSLDPYIMRNTNILKTSIEHNNLNNVLDRFILAPNIPIQVTKFLAFVEIVQITLHVF